MYCSKNSLPLSGHKPNPHLSLYNIKVLTRNTCLPRNYSSSTCTSTTEGRRNSTLSMGGARLAKSVHGKGPQQTINGPAHAYVHAYTDCFTQSPVFAALTGSNSRPPLT